MKEIADCFQIVGLIRPTKSRIRIRVFERLFGAPCSLKHSPFGEDKQRRTELFGQVRNVDFVDLIAKRRTSIIRVARDNSVGASNSPVMLGGEYVFGNGARIISQAPIRSRC